jgi:uncharacterized membrane protein YeaQ/YmgE (transglycosylase-associated protein family)
METFVFMAVGLAAGLLCWFIVPYSKSMGIVRMLLVGGVGGIFGGAVGGSFESGMRMVSITALSLIGAAVGAVVATFVVLSLSRRRAHV